MIDTIQVQAIFCDELRPEANGKFSLMGFYMAELFLLDPINTPVDRIAIAVQAKWSYDFIPSLLKIRVQLPRQEAQDIPFPTENMFKERGEPASEFRTRQFFIGFNLRLLPLQPEDNIDVWLIVDETNIPAGRLRVRSAPLQPENNEDVQKLRT